MKQEIFSQSALSYGEPVEIAGVELVTVDGATMAHINTKGNASLVEMLQRPYRLNAVVALICVSGRLRLSSHSDEYVVSGNKMFLSSVSVLRLDDVADSEFYLLAFGSDFMASMNLNVNFMVDMMTMLHTGARIIDVEASPAASVETMFRGLYTNFKKSEHSIYIELSLRHLFCSMIYRMYEIVAKSGTKTSIDRLGVKDRSAEYFERLVRLLAENFREQRNVEFYADKMNISSKHLSRVIRAFTGKSVHQWIDDFVALEIKNLLKYSDMSIQQISYTLNFPNPSFMGQYFKRITGMTPGEYKRS